MWTVTFDDRRFSRWIDNLDKRLRVVGETVAYMAAEYLKREFRQRIPVGYKTYKNSWRVGRVVEGQQAGGYAVYASARGRRVKTMDVQRTILIIKPVDRYLLMHPELRVLASYSPWTPDTIPYYPPRRMALIISRKVSTEEAKKIRALRNEQRATWEMQMTQAGARPRRRALPRLDPAKATAVPDVAFEGMRLEWGIGGGQRKAHLRPALRALVSRGFSGILRSRRVKDLMEPSSQQWRRGPPPTNRRVGSVMLRSFVAFQRRIGRLV